MLKVFNDEFGNFPKLKFILENSKSNYARFLAASAMKNQLSDNWVKVPQEEKTQIKQYLLAFLKNPALVLGTETY